MEKRNYIPAPIDNKHLVEDAFEDATEIFGNFSMVFGAKRVFSLYLTNRYPAIKLAE